MRPRTTPLVETPAAKTEPVVDNEPPRIDAVPSVSVLAVKSPEAEILLVALTFDAVMLPEVDKCSSPKLIVACDASTERLGVLPDLSVNATPPSVSVIPPLPTARRALPVTSMLPVVWRPEVPRASRFPSVILTGPLNVADE